MSAISPVSPIPSALILASNQFNNASNAVVSAANSGAGGDLATAIINQSTAKQAVQADAATLETQNKLFKAILDIKV